MSSINFQIARITILGFVILLLSSGCSGGKAPGDGNLIWAKRAGGPSYWDEGYGITSLSDNSTVVTGFFEGVAIFGPGDTNQTTLTSTGSSDIFVMRYKPNGTLSWAKSAGGSGCDIGVGITTLSDNSTIATGWYSVGATFGPGEPNETVLSNTRFFNDIFVPQYEPDGEFSWAKSARGRRNYPVGLGITTLSDNSTVVTEYFPGGWPKTPPLPLARTQTIPISFESYDIFVARFNPDGKLSSAKHTGVSCTCGYGITTLSDNSTVVTGMFQGETTFCPGEPHKTILTSAGSSDIFVSRYNPDGTPSWAKHAGGSGYDRGWGITSLSDNSTVVIGNFSETATFGPGEPNETILTSAGANDIFVARFNPDGSLAWAKQAGGSGSNKGYGITTLSDNSTVVTGEFRDSATFGPGEPNETILTSSGYEDIFVARFNPDGSLAWAKRAGGSGHDCGHGITVLSDNSTVVTGYFQGAATFGPDEKKHTVLTSAGFEDIFIARFAP
jgi:hypothetical protein